MVTVHSNIFLGYLLKETLKIYHRYHIKSNTYRTLTWNRKGLFENVCSYKENKHFGRRILLNPVQHIDHLSQRLPRSWEIEFRIVFREIGHKVVGEHNQQRYVDEKQSDQRTQLGCECYGAHFVRLSTGCSRKTKYST